MLRRWVAADNAAMEAEPIKADPPNRKRRWFQFSLRTLMIGVTLLAVACAYVGWQFKIVQERKAKLILLHELGGSSITVSEYVNAVTHGWKRDLRNEELPTIPWPRNWLGDAAVIQILIPESVAQSDAEEISRAFSESRIIRPKLQDDEPPPLSHSAE